MRCIEGDIHEERIVLFLCCPDVVDGIVAHHLAPMAATFPVAAIFLLVGLPGIRLTLHKLASLRILCGDGIAGLCLSGHTATDMTGHIEHLVGIDGHMPLAGHVGIIARLLHVLWPEQGTEGIYIGHLRLVGNHFFRLPQVPPRHQHGSAGHRYGTVPAALVEGVGEVHAVSAQFVQIRGMQFVGTDVPHAIISHVVGKDEQDVGFLLRIKVHRSQGQQA